MDDAAAIASLGSCHLPFQSLSYAARKKKAELVIVRTSLSV